MKAIKSILVAAIMVLITTSVCKAEPTPGISYLMNTPASLFDFGMYKMQNGLEHHLKILNKLSVGVLSEYNWHKNRILITVVDFDDSSKSVEEAKSRCKVLIGEVKRYFRVNPDTGKEVSSELGKEIMRFLFSHFGYRLEPLPANLYTELYNITEIRAGIHIKKGSKTTEYVSKAPLLGTDIFYSEEILESIETK